LEALKEINIIRPVSIRYHKKIDIRFIEKAIDVVSMGMGVPIFFNDEVIIPGLIEKGIPLQDARDYAIIGCIEVTIQGKANPHAVSHMMNLAKCFELSINDGKDFKTGRQLGPKTGYLYESKSKKDLIKNYKKQVEYFADFAVAKSNLGEIDQSYEYPLPVLSIFIDDCIEKCKDITAGGARYNYHSTCGIGIPNVADSISAIDTLCFKEKKIKIKELYEIIKKNFEGEEYIRQMLLNKAPKYGNDIDEVDFIAREIAEHYCKIMEKYKSPTGSYFCHLFSFLWHLNPCGTKCWALPDGRKAGEPLAYSLSSVQGRDMKGATAVCNSVSKIDHKKAAAGTSFILELHPSVFNDNGYKKIAKLTKSFFDKGGGQLQFNVVSAETLKKAQEKPQDYQNLMVRVSGFSSRFVTLDRAMQDHIIARTKHRG
jgi:formate C-acetyltransferase